jgi:hypothetical protein
MLKQRLLSCEKRSIPAAVQIVFVLKQPLMTQIPNSMLGHNSRLLLLALCFRCASWEWRRGDGANYNEGALNVGFFRYNYSHPNVCLLWMTKSGADHLVLSLFTANNTALTPH